MNIEGVLVPIVTPFGADGGVNADALRQLVDRFVEAGVAGIVACGTTGEFYALEDAERELVLRTVAEAARGRITLIAGINALSTPQAIRNARQAQELGYQGLMLTAPPYSLPEQAGILAHFRTVAAATPLPIILYDFPARIGVQIAVETITELARIPNIVGIKESSGNFNRALALIQARIPDFQIVSGSDDMAADFLFWGVRSWISGGANVFPAEQAAMVKAAGEQRWDEVRRLMSGMYPVIQAMESGDYNQKAKLGCRRHGVDAGTVRLPLAPLSAEDERAFIAMLDAYQG
ncbi:4-hydroxy-tetrahydrodipicolinate synthase [Achromobacter pulmonis]|jgi:4-hydroxy-tetrahydrodipicolinate synthase|uniref:4-hydroxy-tetrahydrodipicolinate synthase n=1 Tax=Achromobacter pulmonis TaxID=1389932 RepID=A0A2N8KGN4_9BURK|nr:4-hydroxy-tetrahydrodipicolinate synthase [Achromobacter pulmonis]PND32602.1 4-hydroxy-tetrahydrodipicolinate synthase [Achromobacter pulmonis]